MKAQRLLQMGTNSIVLVGMLMGAIQVFAVTAPVMTAIVVNTLEDELNVDGDCSLREAIAASNNNTAVDACGSGGFATDTINFSVSGMNINGLRNDVESQRLSCLLR